MMIESTENEDELAAQIEKLDDSLEAVHKTLKIEGVKRDKRIRSNRILTIFAVAIAVVGIWVGVQGVNAVNDSNAERDQAREASCQQYNKQQDVQISAEMAQSHDFVKALAGGSTDPDVQAKVDLYNKEHDALISKSHPRRDCSPEGIAKYLK